jgi:uncharacterized protein YggE
MATTTVFGSATVKRPCQRTKLDVTLSASGKTSTKARDKAKALMEDLYAVIRELERAGVGIERDALSSRFSVAQRWTGTGTLLQVESYEARFHVTVESKAIDQAGRIFDALADVKGAQVGSPVFEIDDTLRQEMRNEAFTRAVADAKDRFRFQCEVIGFATEDFEVVSWRYERARYESPSGKQLSIGDERIGISGELASVTCEVYLTYDRKTTDEAVSRTSK